MLSTKVRKYIYMMLTPVAGILVFYGVLSDHEAGMWVSLLGTALLVGEGGLAAINTPASAKETVEQKFDDLLG